MIVLIVTCYYIWLGGKKRRSGGAASLREPDERQAERAVLAEMCHAAPSSWTSGFERSVSPTVSFARTDCRAYLAVYI